jgi:hypothetical protein
MHVIRDRDGNPIKTSRNLRGIREYVGKNLIRVLSVDPIKCQTLASVNDTTGEGKLCILFDNGASYETTFASYSVLKSFVRRWRNVYGSPLCVNGKDCGTVSSNNPALN